MTEWKDIHPELTNQLQWEWHNHKFTAEQCKEWIDIGLKPTEYSFATYLRNILVCSPEETLNFGDLEALREQYQEYLQSQDSNKENETSSLAQAIMLSLGISSPDDLLSKSKLTDQELEPYLSKKRLDLKKYFVFNLGQELSTIPVTVSDYEGKLVSDPVGNIRKAEPLLSQHLTQLFKDGSEKLAIAFTGKNTNHNSPQWTGKKLNHKIRNGKEVYVVFDKSKINTNLSYVRSKVASDTQLGKLDWPIVILAMEVQPQVKVFQSKKNALKFLRENDFKCRAVSCQEEIIGEEDYCLYHQACLAKLEEQKSIPNIQEIDTFETWFNGNCGYVINKDSSKSSVYPYYIWIVVCEPEFNEIGENWAIIDYNWHYKNLIGANKKAKEVKEKLQEESIDASPILLVHPKADKYTPFDDIVNEPYVVDYSVGSSSSAHYIFFRKFNYAVPSKLDYYVKPLDIIKIQKDERFIGKTYYHFGIYLGNDKVFQLQGDNKGANIHPWEEDKHFLDGAISHLTVYHPIISFKHHTKIIEHATRTYWSDYGKGEYCLVNQNCEHFAWSITSGINFSQQVAKEPVKFGCAVRFCKHCGPSTEKNNGKTSVCLKNEIAETNAKFDSLARDKEQLVRSKIEELKAQVVIPLKKDCKLM